MPLGTEVNVGPGDVVLNGVAAPLKAAQPPVSGSCLLWLNGWMDEDALCTEVDLDPGHIVLDGVQALREKGTAAAPFFGPCLSWPRSPISATAELLFIL